MLRIFHGDNTVASRAELNRTIDSAKTKGVQDVVRLQGKKISLNQLVQACETGSLFGTDRLIVIENLHANPSKTTLKQLTEYLSAINQQSELILLWANKTLTPGQLKGLANFTPQIFKISPVVFKLCDSLGTPPTSSLPLLKQAVQADSAEFVLAMLSRQVRLLLQTTDPNFKMAPWQIGKLKQQFQHIGESRIVDMHTKLAQIDWRIKSGQSAHGLEGELELLLAAL